MNRRINDVSATRYAIDFKFFIFPSRIEISGYGGKSPGSTLVPILCSFSESLLARGDLAFKASVLLQHHGRFFPFSTMQERKTQEIAYLIFLFFLFIR